MADQKTLADTDVQVLRATVTRQRRILHLLQEISLAVSRAEETETAFREVLAHICQFMHWPLGHVYVWSETQLALVSSGVWYDADETAFCAFRNLTQETELKPGQGAAGSVLQSGEPLTILDISVDPSFVRQVPPGELGLHAYFAFPVQSGDAIRAVLEFFSPHSAPPPEDMTRIITHVSAQLGLAMRRQRAMARLQQSQTQLAEAQRIAHVAHWEWELSTNRVTWSDELYRIFGLPKGDFSGTYEAFLERIHPDDLEYAQRTIEDACQQGRAFEYYHRIVRPDGTQRVLHGRGRPVFDGGGALVRLQGTAQDVTEQKATELKLARTVRHLSTLMEIGQAVVASLELAVIYERVLTLLRPLLNAEVVLLFLRDGDEFVIEALDQESVPGLRGQRIPVNSGVAGLAGQERRPLLLRGEECRRHVSPALAQTAGYYPQAIIAVPMREQDECHGILEAAHRDEDAFDEEDLRLVEAAATWTVIAIANSRQYEQLERRLRESRAIAAINRALATTLEQDKVLHLIVETARETVPNVDWAAIHLLEGRSERLELAASSGLELGGESYAMAPDEGISGFVLDVGQALNVPDVQQDPRRLPIDEIINARSLLVAPVESRGRRIGVITVECAVPNIFSKEDERMLAILGVQAGIAIDNARLYTAQRLARIHAERQRERMRGLARRVVSAQEEERARIARELHDEAGQSLTSLKISLELLRGALPPEMKDASENLAQLIELADKTMNNLRLLSHNLRPPGLDAYGLHAALDGLCRDFAAHTHLQIRYEGTDVPELPELPALSLYRFAQEALTNAARHADATAVEVALAREGDMITLCVSDDGRGFATVDLEEQTTSRGSGLLGMLERLEMVAGRLEIHSMPGKGSRLQATVPLAEHP